MKNLVLKRFIDKETQVGYSEGDTYESNDSERVAFLVGEGFLKEEKEETKPKRGRKEPKDGE
ncbi:hypothetical protein [Peribacillus asahii]|uniref:hypothetical protein n=1 Tax=Peribacillus asahii TaxID=228899 RepID=UPI00380832DA